MQPEQQQRIMGYFIEEAKDHLNTIEQGLVNLQNTLQDPEMVNEVFRAAHSVKGGAAMLGLNSIQRTSHRLEDCFKVLKECPVSVDGKLESLFLQVSDTLKELLEQLTGPFGLTDETAAGIMSDVEPVFEELNQYLAVLVNQAGGFAPELTSSQEAVRGSTYKRKSAVANSAADLQTAGFQNGVMTYLREMLQQFKQPDQPESRQRLQEICQCLQRMGEEFDLPAWSNLIQTAKDAIANPANQSRTLAPILIKEIKQAQELIMAGRASDIVPSQQLKALLPLTLSSSSVTSRASQTPEFVVSLAEQQLEPIPETTFKAEPAVPIVVASAGTSPDYGRPKASHRFLSSDSGTFIQQDSTSNQSHERHPYIDDEPDSQHSDSTIMGIPTHNGPEVGMAELNSLADLFEGESPDLDQTWQEEEIISNGVSDMLADNSDSRESADPDSDFSDLLNTARSEPPKQSAPLGDDLISLFGDELKDEVARSTKSADDFDFFASEDSGSANEEANWFKPADRDTSEDQFAELLFEAGEPIQHRTNDPLAMLENNEASFQFESETSELDEMATLFGDSYIPLNEEIFGESESPSVGGTTSDWNASWDGEDPILSSLSAADSLAMPEADSRPEFNLDDLTLSPDSVQDDFEASLFEGVGNDFSTSIDSEDFFGTPDTTPVDQGFLEELVMAEMNAEADEAEDSDIWFDEALPELNLLQDLASDEPVTQIEDPLVMLTFEPEEEPDIRESVNLDFSWPAMGDELLTGTEEAQPFELEDALTVAELSADPSAAMVSDTDEIDLFGFDDTSSSLDLDAESDNLPDLFELDTAEAEPTEATTNAFELAPDAAPAGLSDEFTFDTVETEPATFDDGFDFETSESEPVVGLEAALDFEGAETESVEELIDALEFETAEAPSNVQLSDELTFETIQIEFATASGDEFDFDTAESAATAELEDAFGIESIEVAPDAFDEGFDFDTAESAATAELEDGFGLESLETQPAAFDEGFDFDTAEALPSAELEDAFDFGTFESEPTAELEDGFGLESLETQPAAFDEGFDFETAEALPSAELEDSFGLESLDTQPASFDEGFDFDTAEALPSAELEDAFDFGTIGSEPTAELEDSFGLESLDTQPAVFDEGFDFETAEALPSAELEDAFGLESLDTQPAAFDEGFDFDTAEALPSAELEDAFGLESLETQPAAFDEGFDFETAEALPSAELGDAFDFGTFESEPTAELEDGFGLESLETQPAAFDEGFDFDTAEAEDVFELAAPTSTLSSEQMDDFELTSQLDSDVDSLDNLFEEQPAATESWDGEISNSLDPEALDLAETNLFEGDADLMGWDLETIPSADEKLEISLGTADNLESLLSDESSPTADNLSFEEDLLTISTPQEDWEWSATDQLDEADALAELNIEEAVTPTSDSGDWLDDDMFSLLGAAGSAVPEISATAPEEIAQTSDTIDWLETDEEMVSLLGAAGSALPETIGTADFELTDELSLLETTEAQNPELALDFGGETDDFADLEAILSEDTSTSAEPAVSQLDDFDDLEALLSDLPQDEKQAPAVNSSQLTTPSNLVDDEFGELEAMLVTADQTMGGSQTAKSNIRQTAPAGSSRRGSRVFEQTMRVPVKHLDNLSNLVGELVVNRNTLEQDQERLRQFLDNLLHQVQQLSDAGARMQDRYERSLLESALLSSRHDRRFAAPSRGEHTGTGAAARGEDTGIGQDISSTSVRLGLGDLEIDRGFTPFHTLAQEIIELIVRVRESASDIEFIVDETDQVARMLRQITTQLQEGLTRARMVPFAQTADRLPRAVKEVSHKCGKQADLQIEGRETLLDKVILEHLSDPMTHLINNAITHGIETPEERKAAGKSPVGRITVRAFHQGNQTVISVSDDGAGIDTERVKVKAVEKGLITRNDAQNMSRLDVYDLLFHPGFSTKDKADDFAGRGVGMDVVRTSLTEIRGTISIDSTIGKGTTFTIRLPLTLSICKALRCLSDKALIAFPMDGVEDMLDIPKERVQVNAEQQTFITWRDTLLPFQPLSNLLTYNRHFSRSNVYGGNREDEMISIVVLRSAGNFIALEVDQVLGEQEIVIKQLEGPVPKPVGVAGATVLGDGRIMPIADVLELIDLSRGVIRKNSGGSLWDKPGGTQQPVETPAEQKEPMVLIVDDSITVRELLSMTFNKAGYRVEQARDGQEAWEKLRSGLPCDIVFCDIEMPRMDGLELLSRLEKDPNLKHLPVAMLTSRGADRHRQMAAQLGASGYFTKPYLEEVLLDAAQRMMKGEKLVTTNSNA